MAVRINISKIGLNFYIDFWKKITFTLNFNQYIFGVKETIGIRNNTTDGKRLFFADYDQILYEEMLLPEIKYLQDKYGLSDFYIFKSSQKPNSYHAVCFDKLKTYEWKDIIEESSCDENYKKPSLKDFKTAVLRIAPKGSSNAPRFYKRIRSPYNAREKSLAHINFFQLHYDIPKQDFINTDNSEKIILVDYKTLNYLKGVK